MKGIFIEMTEQAPASPSPQYKGHPAAPFLRAGTTVQIQSVLFNNDPKALERSVASIGRAVKVAITDGTVTRVDLRYGDCSPVPCLDKDALGQLETVAAGALSISYEHFGANLGSAGGHNRIAAGAEADFILVENPDVVLSSRLLSVLLTTFVRAGVGIVEGKQLPLEHPKDYDPMTGETSWASTACAMIPVPLFRDLGGFDADSFFLYCDDVDFSWRVRLAGFHVIIQPAATVFHDKRLTRDGKWKPSSMEHRYSAEAALFLAHKWSRPDVVSKLLAYFHQSADENLNRAARVYDDCQLAGRLPLALDANHKIGQFVGNFYAKHRFAL